MRAGKRPMEVGVDTIKNPRHQSVELESERYICWRSRRWQRLIGETAMKSHMPLLLPNHFLSLDESA